MSNVRREVILGYQEQLATTGRIIVKDRDKMEGVKLLQGNGFTSREQEKRFYHSWLATEQCVGFYGSARLGKNTSDYKWARQLGYTLTKEFGVSWVTGGGPNLMEAPLEGAYSAKNEDPSAKSYHARNSKLVGITLAGFLNEQAPNEWLEIVRRAESFGDRVDGFINTNHAGIFGWGGYGTIWELMAFLQAKQAHIQHLEIGFPADFPIIVHPTHERWLKTVTEDGYFLPSKDGKPTVISKHDTESFTITDDINEIRCIVGANIQSWNENVGRWVVRDRKKR